jgi:hypothetical protein
MKNQYTVNKVTQLEPCYENPIKELVYDCDDQEAFIGSLLNANAKLRKEIEIQKNYKKNKEFIYTNRLERRFYYHRDKLGVPRITVCVIYDSKQEMYHRGISICSYLDIANKEEGRDIAEDRAINAMRSKISKEEINRGDIIQMECDINSGIYYDYKSDYDVIITEFEKELFTPKIIKEQ